MSQASLTNVAWSEHMIITRRIAVIASGSPGVLYVCDHVRSSVLVMLSSCQLSAFD